MFGTPLPLCSLLCLCDFNRFHILTLDTAPVKISRFQYSFPRFDAKLPAIFQVAVHSILKIYLKIPGIFKDN